MDKRIDLALKLIAWGIIAFVIVVILLKFLGLIGSPELTNALLLALLFESVRIEGKFNKWEPKLELIWSEFKRRKKL